MKFTPIQQKIFNYLQIQEGEQVVNTMAHDLNIDRGNLSRHIKKLQENNIVKTWKEGRNVMIQLIQVQKDKPKPIKKKTSLEEVGYKERRFPECSIPSSSLKLNTQIFQFDYLIKQIENSDLPSATYLKEVLFIQGESTKGKQKAKRRVENIMGYLLQFQQSLL